jgi:hypothetical protein
MQMALTFGIEEVMAVMRMIMDGMLQLPLLNPFNLLRIITTMEF